VLENNSFMQQNDNSNSMWTEKYRPKTLTDYYISKQQLEIVKDWINALKSDDEDAKPFLILYGTAGIGKTTLAHLIFQKFGYEIIECNASDTRSKKQIKENIGGIAKVSVCVDSKNKFKPTAIIMDEIDGLNGVSESSGVQELIDIVISKDKQSKEVKWVCPVICTTNSIKEKKLQVLLKYGIVLNLNKPGTHDCLKLINKICKEEKFSILDTEKNNIINNANGDYRQIIMLLYEYYNKTQQVILDRKEKHLDNKNIIDDVVICSNNIVEGDEFTYDVNVIKNINNQGETPLDKINYFITHNIDLDTIRYFCSGDSNLFFMNFYSNIISIISTIQERQNNKNKQTLLQNYKILTKVYESVKNADLMNNSIFLDKHWDLLDYFDIFSVGIPTKILYNHNNQHTNKKTILENPIQNSELTIPQTTQLVVSDFNLCHHTQYNYMRQEQAMNKKKLNIDYIKTHENDIANIYYNLKRFQHNNQDDIKKFGNKSKKKNIDPEEGKFIIDKSYSKILEKFDELLS